MIAWPVGTAYPLVGADPDDGSELLGVLDLEDASRVRGRLKRFGADGSVPTDLYDQEFAIRAEARRGVRAR